MTLLDTIAARLGYIKAPQSARDNARLMSAGDTWLIPGEHIPRNQAEMMQRLSWVYIAVSRIAQTGAAARLSVKRLDGERAIDIPNHPFELFLERPNEYMSRFEFIEATLAYRALTGNCYWWLNKSGENAPPVEAWIIPPNLIRPVPDGRLGIRGYLYDPGFGQPSVPLELWEVVHFKSFHPTNPYVGLSPIEALVNQAVGDIKATEWNAAFFGENNAKIPGALAFADNINDADWERMQEEFKRQFGGTKRHLLMLRGVGERSVSWVPMGLSQADMQFLAGREFTRDEIFNVFAPGLASMLAVNATEATATAGRMTFLEQAVWPHLEAVAQKITARVLPLYGEGLRAEFDDIRMTDRAMELQELRTYALTHTVNEVRARYYDDSPLDDERGNLLIAQIGLGTGVDETNDAPSEPLGVETATDDDTGADVDSEQRPAESAAKAGVIRTLADELSAWERKATKRFREGKPERGLEFVSDVIPEPLSAAIRGALEVAQSEAEVRAAFAWGMYP